MSIKPSQTPEKGISLGGGRRTERGAYGIKALGIRSNRYRGSRKPPKGYIRGGTGHIANSGADITRQGLHTCPGDPSFAGEGIITGPIQNEGYGQGS